ncbi:hypothetical protein BJ742DRAFT_766751 [Cladochytrium replicatum]|nr:hypothetical protein BJ742DRAFT_766751 [Cladochytrium replicatum]
MHECFQLAVESRDSGSLRNSITIINERFRKSWDWHHDLKGFWDAAVKVWIRQYEKQAGGNHGEKLNQMSNPDDKPGSDSMAEGLHMLQPEKPQRSSSRTCGDNPPHYAQAVAGWFADEKEFRVGELPEMLRVAMQRLKTIERINDAAGSALRQTLGTVMAQSSS